VERLKLDYDRNRWQAATLLAVILQLAVIVYGAGRITERLDGVVERMDRIERIVLDGRYGWTR